MRWEFASGILEFCLCNRPQSSSALGVFACRIIVQDQQLELCAAVTLRVFQDFLLLPRIAEGGDRTATDILVDPARALRCRGRYSPRLSGPACNAESIGRKRTSR
jgi:hypothetical protein